MNRFFIYKEYGAKYDMMTADISAASASMPEWESYQKGLEALASTVGSVNSNSDTTKKSLTLSDLLMKVCNGSLFTSAQMLIVIAYPKDMQVSASLFRVAEIHSSVRLPEFSYGS
jgi:hypothetical protein